jgi:hypothetical protein
MADSDIDWRGTLEELKKPTFRDWFHILEFDVKRALDHFVGHVLRKICWIGVNDAGKLVVACPQFDDSGSCIHVSSKDSRAFTWILKDTERSATFACLTNTCFIVHPRLDGCQDTPHPQWRYHVPALITSVCQYRWLGADNWAQTPRSDLVNGSVYWMATSEDKRLVAIETHPSSPVRLIVFNSPTPWRLLRRAWERFERIREATIVELRENSFMEDDRATDVVIVHE